MLYSMLRMLFVIFVQYDTMMYPQGATSERKHSRAVVPLPPALCSQGLMMGRWVPKIFNL